MHLLPIGGLLQTPTLCLAGQLTVSAPRQEPQPFPFQLVCYTFLLLFTLALGDLLSREDCGRDDR